MNIIRLRNASKALVIVPPNIKVLPDKVSEFDGDNPSVQVYARGGLLVPSDAASKSWANKLVKE